MAHKADVIVIGAGPTGSIAARTLAQQGFHVNLLEKGEFPHRVKACGGMLPLSAFPEHGLDETTIETRLEEEIFVFPWGTRTRPSKVATVQRARFDAALAWQAREAGAVLIENTSAKQVERRGAERFRVHAVDREGWKEFESRLVIFADGANTLAHKDLGIGFERTPGSTATGLEYSFDAPNNGCPRYWIYFNQPELGSAWGYTWIFPNRDHLNAGVFFPAELGHSLAAHGKALEHWMNTPRKGTLGEQLQGQSMRRKTGAYIPMRAARKLTAESALVAGDAVGLVFPLTAGGISIGLWSGKLAGEAAAASLRKGLIDQAPIQEYEKVIKHSGVYRELAKQGILYRVEKIISRLDRHAYARLFQMYKLKNELSLWNKLRILVCW